MNTEDMKNSMQSDMPAARRQSAPRPSLFDALRRKKRTQEISGGGDGGIAENVPEKIRLPIGEEQIREAYATLRKYKGGKANLEKRIIDGEQWYKLRHWECMRDKKQEVQPSSAWLFNCIANKHASAMDNMPAPNVLPREEGDKGEAEMLSAIIPVILEQTDFEQVYSDAWDHKCKSGTAVYGVFWDKDKHGGLGDISVRDIDLLNLYWEPGIRDIQASKNVFSIELADRENLYAAYPQLVGKLDTSVIDVAHYEYDDTVDTSDKAVVIDWYYKKNAGGKTVLHYCKFVGDTVLYATENDPQLSERGLYDHAEYPFVFDVLFPIAGTPAGFGYIDIGKDTQAYIDRGNQALMKNMLWNAAPRVIISEDSGLNEEEFTDLSCEIVHSQSGISERTFTHVQPNTLDSIYVTLLQGKIDELKETTGNRDISTGGTTSGVTAASAIAAMQEAGSKLDRDANKASYRAFRRICLLIIELIRQFYDIQRSFRIIGERGAARYVSYSNEGIVPQAQNPEFGVDLGFRTPVFDIEITAEKASPYSRMAQNELALQFYSAGFFVPQNADQAIACLDMMDFDRKQQIIDRISQNGTMYQQLMVMQEQLMMLSGRLDQLTGSDISGQIAAQMQSAPMQNTPGGGPSPGAEGNEALGDTSGADNSVTKNARERVAQSTAPR